MVIRLLSLAWSLEDSETCESVIVGLLAIV